MTDQKPPEVVNTKDVEENKTIAAIGYLGILCLLPLLMKKDSKFAQFHGKQSLVLLIASVIVSFINIIPILGQLIWIVAMILFTILMVVGIIKALNGQWWEMPILGEYAKKIKL
jgi:fumarate reductase subunit D